MTGVEVVDTSALRMSHALNESGFTISKKDGRSAMRGKDGKFYLVVPVQTVDATPSGIKQFSKVVFMRPGIRFGLSAEQKTDVWRRWRAGQT
ncbi:MAG TPA: hypothetical protein VL128_05975, partial [Candidatus Eisenbacteria bacterium]|nr:hypothetical protein [Candidatus Eisenbacteria bacterium]